MRKYLQSEIKEMFKTGELKDIKTRNKQGYTRLDTTGLIQIGYNAGVYGCNCEIYEDPKTGELFIYNFRVNLPR